VLTRRTLIAAAVIAAFFGAAPNGRAEDYPTRTITVIVPYPPGGGVDAMARVAAQKLAAAFGQQVVVDNRAGGSGLVGTRAAIKSAPDGYTLFLGHTGSLAINPSLYVHADFDPRKDFAPIGLMASMPVALLAHPSFPVKTIKDVIALGRQEPGKYNIGTSAVGTGGYLAAELFKSLASVDMTIIPYKGTGQVMNDLLGGHVPIAFGVLPPALGNIRSGTLRAVAILSPTRSSLLPDVPTAEESGMPGFDAVLHYGLLAPAGTPRPIIDRLNKELRALVATEEITRRIHAEGGDPLTSSPDEYAADIDREEAKWGTLVRKLNLKVE
jgi:tripartite-type tricarboxylate transporter receptor subunit TctC